MDSQEIIDLLEKARKQLTSPIRVNGKLSVPEKFCLDYINQAHTLLREAPEQQPTAGELIETRIFEGHNWVSAKDWNKLRASLDRAEAENKRVNAGWATESQLRENLLQENYKYEMKIEQLESLNIEKTIALANELDDCKPYAGAMQMRKALESINTDLLAACEKVRDWLDTSSLQQILVHYTEDKRRHALIMGIASHLERLEAAIAKANPVYEREII